MISIITVCFNAAKDLEQTILSVRAQKLITELRYIIVDGNSSDGTLDMIHKYKDVVDEYISENDSGIYDAMNKGWFMAPDSFILYLGAGDTLINLPDLSAISNYDVIAGNVLLGGGTLFCSKINFKLKLGNTLHHQALLVKKSIHPEPPFNTKFKTYADFDFNQRLYKLKASFVKVNNFAAYAKEGGVSQVFAASESLAVVQQNFGIYWKAVAMFYYFLQGKTW